MNTNWSDALYDLLRESLPDSVAIFQSQPVPHDQPYPFVVFDGATTALNNDAIDTRVENITVDLFFYDTARSPDGGNCSSARVQDMAQRVARDLNDNTNYDIDDQCVNVAFTNAPTVAPTDDTVHGRLVVLNLRIEDF